MADTQCEAKEKKQNFTKKTYAHSVTFILKKERNNEDKFMEETEKVMMEGINIVAGTSLSKVFIEFCCCWR